MNINQLLEKYWNAEASLQDEAELRAYFSSTDVAPNHEQYKDLFAFFSLSRMQSSDLDVEKLLSNLSNIDLILEKYWNAEASLEEEIALRNYFNSDTVALQHEQYKDLFVFHKISRSQTTDLDVSKVLNNHLDIDSILEKYWNTETSLEEENLLKVYFLSGNVAEKHMAYRGIFDIYSTKSTETTDLDITSILSEAAVNEDGNGASDISEIPHQSKAKIFSLQKWAVRIAAVFILGFAAVSVMNQTTKTQYKGHATVLDNEAEAQEAYEITKEALAFLSKKMNKGSKTIVESVSKVEKASIFK